MTEPARHRVELEPSFWEPAKPHNQAKEINFLLRARGLLVGLSLGQTWSDWSFGKGTLGRVRIVWLSESG